LTWVRRCLSREPQACLDSKVFAVLDESVVLPTSLHGYCLEFLVAQHFLSLPTAVVKVLKVIELCVVFIAEFLRKVFDVHWLPIFIRPRMDSSGDRPVLRVSNN
jgi:hypothetical protein